MVKKEVILVFAVVLLLVFAGLSSAVTANKTQIKECKQDCRANRVLDKIECKASYEECREDCRGYSCRRTCTQEKNLCLKEANDDYKVCQDICKHGLFDFSISQDSCTEAGGFYESLCNGPYFGVVCTQTKFCMCKGNEDYSCPVNYSCVKNFKTAYMQYYSVEGWVNLLGQPLGNIGLCAKNPIEEQNSSSEII